MILRTLARFLSAACLMPMLMAQSNPKDAKGSADSPLFPNRMPGYIISTYQTQGFTSYSFRMKPPIPVEGKYTRIGYYLSDPKAHPGGLAIRRNYENAIMAAGGQVTYSDDNVSVVKAVRNGVEVWAEIQAPLKYSGRYYYLHIVEKEAMRQVITADAMGASIDKDGFVALDIRFATGKADILPESQPIVKEIVALLNKRSTLKVGVEGHTDNTGTPDSNLALSRQRAESVVAALQSAGIQRTRLTPAGFGQTKPVADNRAEEGRAKNRRVEIVRK
ncbi:MAG: OmpA family protein [Acidobacteria bacterium]|nr:OmpA family protein [Acidobacteriota bacterium]